MAHPLAGKPAPKDVLVDVKDLLLRYANEEPDPGDPAQRVAFGTSGHRGSSLRRSFNEAHIAATTQAICDYRREQGYDGPLFIGRDTHGLSTTTGWPGSRPRHRGGDAGVTSRVRPCARRTRRRPSEAGPDNPATTVVVGPSSRQSISTTAMGDRLPAT